MLILGIETATPQVGCAIGGHEGVLASFHSSRGKRHAESLAPAIDFIRRQARIDLQDISAVAVDVGPGLFTGLRVGLAAAKAMAQALRVPMVPIMSVDLLAHPVRFSNRLIAAVVDARRHELFYALYRQVPGGVQRVSEVTVGGIGDLASELQARSEDALIVGDGALRYRDELSELGSVELCERGLAYPLASSIVQLAHPQAMREEFVQPRELQPVYLRKPDAEINWATRSQVAS